MKDYQLGLSSIFVIFIMILALIVGNSSAVLIFSTLFYLIGNISCFSIEKSSRREGITLFNYVFSCLILFAIIHYLDILVNYNDFAVDWNDEYKFWLLSEELSSSTSAHQVFISCFSSGIFQDVSGYLLYIGSLSYIAQNYFDGNNLLLQFIGTTFFGGMSSILLYKIFLLYFPSKVAFKHVFQFSLLSIIFAYSFVLLRDIVIVFFYLWVFYILLIKFKIRNVLKILLITLIVWQFRAGHALFLLIFLVYYLYNTFKKNKIILWLSILLVTVVAFLTLNQAFISASSTIDRYGERGEASALEISDSVGKSLYSLPSPIQELTFFLYAHIKPFPSWNSLSNSKGIYSGIVNTLPIIYSLYWFIIVFSLSKMFITYKIYQFIPKNLIFLLILCVVFVFLVSLGASDIRRMMNVYPIYFLVYAVGCSKITHSKKIKSKFEAITSYLLLILVYLIIKA